MQGVFLYSDKFPINPIRNLVLTSSYIIGPSYLEVPALVERVGRPEERHLPLEHVLVVDQLGADPLEGVVLQRLELEGERAHRRGGAVPG